MKSEGIIRNERYFDEPGRPSSPKQPKDKIGFFTVEKDKYFGKL